MNIKVTDGFIIIPAGYRVITKENREIITTEDAVFNADVFAYATKCDPPQTMNKVE